MEDGCRNVPSSTFIFSDYLMRNKLAIVSLCIALLPLHSSAQNGADKFQEKFDKFKKQKQGKYDNFRNEVNRKYADFIRQSWAKLKPEPPVVKPKEEDVPPVIVPPQDTISATPIIDTPLPPIINVIEPPVIESQPIPVAPIQEIPMPVTEDAISTDCWGTTFNVRFSNNQKFKLNGYSNEDVAYAWEKMSEESYNNTIRDCLLARAEHQLNDWAYLNFLHNLSQTIYGNSNEAVLLTAYLYCQSGYKIRFARNGSNLRMLFSSQHCIYGKSCFVIDGFNFYVFGEDITGELEFCPGTYPNEKPLSLLIPKQPVLDISESAKRTLVSSAYPEISINVSVNENIVKLCSEYPSSFIDNDFMTRWAMYANTPLADDVKEQLYPQLNQIISGQTQLEAVNRLLNWIQTGFVYEYDDKVWGDDRPFFAEETLYYPYCDCEDRAILLSRLVRDLLNLDAILVYYPGHLAMAVGFTEEVKGDHITVDNKRFIVCDPTYINAPAGKTMPDMDNSTAKIALLSK